MNKFQAAVAQLTSTEDVEANLRASGQAIAEARERGAQVVLLPENFAFMGSEATRAQIAESVGGGGRIHEFLRASAKQHQIAIVAGGMPEQSDDARRPYNASVVYGSDGSILAHYRKVHLFDVDLPDGTTLCESASTKPGSSPVVCQLGEVRLGVSICYDLRFPELYRLLVGQGATVLAVTAAFTLHTGRDHWEVLLRARAIESQCWVLAAAQWGRHSPTRTTYGRSMIVDPWGTVVAQASDGNGVVVADVDLEHQARIRSALPCLLHRRL
ncbi:MAG: carbon-nitrogen hydrolase family protein [Polyangiaceae bacterium]|nr:carbon-nitrogen hydrolase family protein [Polyangiaceae bacterium]